MSGAAHTPGGWQLADNDPTLIVTTHLFEDGNCRVIADVCHPGNNAPEFEANARLIAAAPDLLTALQAVNKLIAEAAATGFNWQSGDWPEKLFNSQQATSTAIEKATGAK